MFLIHIYLFYCDYSNTVCYFIRLFSLHVHLFFFLATAAVVIVIVMFTWDSRKKMF
jgi:hypothetical protein